jgi:PAS domain-containing protein
MREAIDTRTAATVDIHNYRKDGTEFRNRVTITPVENDAGEVTHFVGFQQPLSDGRDADRTSAI